MSPNPLPSSSGPDAAPPALVFGDVNTALNQHWREHETALGARPSRTFASPEAFECLAAMGGTPRTVRAMEAVISRGGSGEVVGLAVDFALDGTEFCSESAECLVDA